MKLSIMEKDRRALVRGEDVRVVVPARRPRPGAVKPRPPQIEGRCFEVTSQRLVGRADGGTEARTMTLVVTCVSLIALEDGSFEALLRAGDHTDPVRLLVATHGVPIDPKTGEPAEDVDGDYTSSRARALPGEPEAVSELDQERISKGQLRRYNELKADVLARRAAVSGAKRLRVAVNRAEDLGVDVSVEMAEIDDALRRVERKIEETGEGERDAA